MITFKDLARCPIQVLIDRIKSGEPAEEVDCASMESLKEFMIYDFKRMYLCEWHDNEVNRKL
jgi:hypothetical protein